MPYFAWRRAHRADIMELHLAGKRALVTGASKGPRACNRAGAGRGGLRPRAGRARRPPPWPRRQRRSAIGIRWRSPSLPPTCRSRARSSASTAAAGPLDYTGQQCRRHPARRFAGGGGCQVARRVGLEGVRLYRPDPRAVSAAGRRVAAWWSTSSAPPASISIRTTSPAARQCRADGVHPQPGQGGIEGRHARGRASIPVRSAPGGWRCCCGRAPSVSSATRRAGRSSMPRCRSAARQHTRGNRQRGGVPRLAALRLHHRHHPHHRRCAALGIWFRRDGAGLIRQAEDARWQSFFTAAPERRRVGEPSSKGRKAIS